MKIIGLCQRLKESVEVEIEVSFIPGLPQIHLIGQADMVLKESLLKIKSVIKSLDIELPKSKQIIVNLRAGDFKKKSLDLELPIIIAILYELQILEFNDAGEVYAHGELGLEGKIFSNDLLLYKKLVSDKIFISGSCPQGSLSSYHRQFEALQDLVYFYATEEYSSQRQTKEDKSKLALNDNKLASTFNVLSNRKISPQFDKDPTQIIFSEEQRQLLKIVSLGRHSMLIMGPRGLGKSTLAESLNFLAEPPDEDTFLHQLKYFFVEEGWYWRPFVNPHHSISHLALVGGGSQCLPGEITRAHGGILLLDEFLEFDPKCQEALREPMQTKSIHLARGQKYQRYECDFQLIATTNLCICGQWLPGKSLDCSYSQARCAKYRDKLSGPVIDRFEILSFMKPAKNDGRGYSLEFIAKEITDHRVDFKELRESLKFNKKLLSKGLRQRLDNELGSLRRLNASIEIAKTLCILKGQDQVSDEILNEALEYTWKPFLDLKS